MKTNCIMCGCEWDNPCQHGEVGTCGWEVANELCSHCTDPWLIVDADRTGITDKPKVTMVVLRRYYSLLKMKVRIYKPSKRHNPADDELVIDYTGYDGERFEEITEALFKDASRIGPGCYNVYLSNLGTNK